MLGKMTELGGFIINGLMTNPTLSTESIVIFVHDFSQKATNSLKTKQIELDVELRPSGMEIEVVETRATKLRQAFQIQEGAGQGTSICNI